MVLARRELQQGQKNRVEGLEAWEELHFQQRGQPVTESVTIKDILKGDVKGVYGAVKGSGPGRGSPTKAHV